MKNLLVRQNVKWIKNEGVHDIYLIPNRNQTILARENSSESCLTAINNTSFLILLESTSFYYLLTEKHPLRGSCCNLFNSNATLFSKNNS